MTDDKLPEKGEAPDRTEGGLGRRRFLGLCGVLGLSATSRPAAAAPAKAIKRFERARLVDAEGNPIKAAALEEGMDYLFHYPFAGTPCLLTDLGAPPEEGVPLKTLGGQPYASLAGVGPKGSVVAYSAICTHLLTHPNKNNSFVNYYHEMSELAERGKVITCCAHGSIFDVTRGGEVIAGEAKQPLLSVALEHDPADDSLHAVGILGDDMLFRHFLTIFKRDLRWQFGPRGAQRPVKGTATLKTLDAFTQQKISC